MGTVQLTFLGSGDAFGSGGRFQSCIMGKSGNERFLIDCGASSLIAIRKHLIDPNDLGAILVSSFHGDHFGGVPYFLVDAQLMRKRTRDLAVAGPLGLKRKLAEVMEAAFPGSSDMKMRFRLDVDELQPGHGRSLGELRVIASQAAHSPRDSHIHLRIECGGKVIVYSGDTEWTDALEAMCEGADLLIAESYFFDKKVKYHLDFGTLSQKLGKIGAKRVVLTHMSEEMLARAGESGCECAADGKRIEI